MRTEWLMTNQVAQILGVSERTLRRYESTDGRWCEILGFRFRVYRTGAGPHVQRRYLRAEIERIQEQLQGIAK